MGVLVSLSALIDLVEKFLVLPPLLPVPLRAQLNTIDLSPPPPATEPKKHWDTSWQSLIAFTLHILSQAL